jgi:xylan 1,4-beta-xylosidase
MGINFMKKIIAHYLVIVFLIFCHLSKAQNPFINFDLKKEVGEMKPVWAWFGYDEPNYTYMKDGKKLLSEIAALSPVPVYVRTHSLLVSGDGVPALKWGSTNAYTEDVNGNRMDRFLACVAYLDGIDSLYKSKKPLDSISKVSKSSN